MMICFTLTEFPLLIDYLLPPRYWYPVCGLRPFRLPARFDSGARY